jgi:hypothetical protein
MPKIALDKIIKSISYGVALSLKGFNKEAIGGVLRAKY